MFAKFAGLSGAALALFVFWWFGTGVLLVIDYRLSDSGAKTITRWCSERPARSFGLFCAALCGPLWLLLHLLSFRG